MKAKLCLRKLCYTMIFYNEIPKHFIKFRININKIEIR